MTDLVNQWGLFPQSTLSPLSHWRFPFPLVLQLVVHIAYHDWRALGYRLEYVNALLSLELQLIHLIVLNTHRLKYSASQPEVPTFSRTLPSQRFAFSGAYTVRYSYLCTRSKTLLRLLGAQLSGFSHIRSSFYRAVYTVCDSILSIHPLPFMCHLSVL